MPNSHRHHSKNMKYVQNLLGIYLLPFSPWYLSVSEKQTSAVLLKPVCLTDSGCTHVTELRRCFVLSKTHILGFAAFRMTFDCSFTVCAMGTLLFGSETYVSSVLLENYAISGDRRV